MSKNSLREDKTCLNCNHVVEKRFCPNCGQENANTRKTFHHLFVHFFEDLTHYENAFWKTIKNLILRPGSLTKEYLSGKRLSYLAPVRLYIFISFVVFLGISFLPDNEEILKTTEKTSISTKFSKNDSLKLAKVSDKKWNVFGISTVAQLDSIQQLGGTDKLSPRSYWVAKKAVTVFEHNSTDEIISKFKESFLHNFPKVLFLYMPIFALLLYLFQNKKKYFYFDHGIFTLHYFSFLLLMFFLLMLISSLLETLFSWAAIDALDDIIQFLGVLYMLYYFFPAHHRFYGESRLITIIKGIVMFFINMFFIILILMLFAIYTFINLH